MLFCPQAVTKILRCYPHDKRPYEFLEQQPLRQTQTKTSTESPFVTDGKSAWTQTVVVMRMWVCHPWTSIRQWCKGRVASVLNMAFVFVQLFPEEAFCWPGLWSQQLWPDKVSRAALIREMVNTLSQMYHGDYTACSLWWCDSKMNVRYISSWRRLTRSIWQIWIEVAGIDTFNLRNIAYH